MLPQLGEQLLDQWSDLPVDRPQPNGLSFLGVRTEVDAGYAFFLAFADRDRVPCLAVKVARVPAFASRLQHEWHMLTHLQQYEPYWLGVSLPRPLLCEVIGGICALVITAPLGQPMRASMSSASAHFASIADWLVQVACATRTCRPISAILGDLERTAVHLCTTFELSDRETSVVEAWITDWSKAAEDAHMDLFTAHGNLRRRHIWSHEGHLTVINWERSELACLPLEDMFLFITTYLFPTAKRRSKETYLRSFRATYLTDGRYADLVRQTIVSYCRALDIPLDSVEACFGLFLARAAIQEYDQLLAAADRGFLPLLNDEDRSARPPYRQAIKDQLWINLLRLLIKERDRFNPTTQENYSCVRCSAAT